MVIKIDSENILTVLLIATNGKKSWIIKDLNVSYI